MQWDPAGKVVVITGASSGIGEASARRLARAGMTVVAAARRTDRLAALATSQPGIVTRPVDVTDIESVDALADWVAAEFGVCHALINNAGIGGGTFFERDDLDDALHTLDVNLSGPIRCMASFVELLAASAPSRVVNVASVVGKLGIGPAAYASSKFGLVGFTEATAFSWRERGIAVTQLNPGFVKTEGFRQQQVMRTPLRRIVKRPEDVARAVHRVLLTGQPERTVPGWYRGLVVSRHVAAPLYRAIASRMKRAGGTRD